MLKLILAILLLIIVLLTSASFLYYTTKSLIFPQKSAPYVWSFKRHLDIMKQLDIKKWTTMLDLWCWDGKALRFFQKNFDIKKWTWYDINPYAIIRWKILNKIYWYKNIQIHKSDFLKANLKWYDYIYTYLRTSQLIKIEARIRKNKDKNTIIISNSFEYSKHKPFKILKDKKWKPAIFLYK